MLSAGLFTALSGAGDQVNQFMAAHTEEDADLSNRIDLVYDILSTSNTQIEDDLMNALEVTSEVNEDVEKMLPMLREKLPHLYE